MSWIGKLIGGLFGLMLAGPIGMLAGIFVGHQFDKAFYRHLMGRGHHAEAQQAFFTATFKIMGHVAKADGRISEDEIRVARAIMQRMGLNEEQRRKAIELFTEGKQPDFNLQQALQELIAACHQSRPLLQMFLEIQLQAAMADGGLSAKKKAVLQHICQQLGFSPISMFAFEDFFNTQRNYQYRGSYSGGGAATPPKPPLSDAYSILGIDKAATNAEVKRAYRRSMSQNHPDKLVAKGLPEEMMKMATEKTQKIQAAYEQICTARGM